MKKLYTVRDRLAYFGDGQRYGLPAILDMPNDEYAIRVLKASCAAGEKPNIFNTNPEDKELWCIGEFDVETGHIKGCEPYLVGRAIDFIEIVKEVKKDD